jgi:rhodanese-related sulfurtransferase
MQRLIEYAQHHPFLLSAAVALAVVVIAYEIREQARATTALSGPQAVRLMNDGALVIDVRGKDQYESGHIGDARHVPAAELAQQADALKKWREKPVIAYCDTGVSAAAATKTLAQLGFTQVFNLAGGLEQWRRDNLPLVKGNRK